MMKIILASGSPRRRELMKMTGLDFSVEVSAEAEDNIDTSLPPEIYAGELAVLKGVSVAKDMMKKEHRPLIVISADTIVYSNGQILGKPKDADEAKNMLNSLSGKTHSVYTGISVLRTSDSLTVSKTVKTDVTFKTLSADTVDAYIKTGEPMDKAGAYGIQGKGSMLISGINGDYFNVVGLPLAVLCDILRDEFGINIFRRL